MKKIALYHHIMESLASGRTEQATQMFSDVIKSHLAEAEADHKINTLLEIKWNSPEVVNSALDAEISCGFEAETIWMDFTEGMTTDEINELTYYDNEIQDMIGREMVGQEIQNDYTDWLINSSEWYDRYYEQMVQSFIDDLSEDQEDDLFDEFVKELGTEDFGELEPQLDEFRQKLIQGHQKDIKTIQGRIKDLRDSVSDGDSVDEFDIRNMERGIEFHEAEIDDLQELSYELLFAIYAKDGDLPGPSEAPSRTSREYWTSMWRQWIEETVGEEYGDEIHDQTLEQLQEDITVDDWISREYNGSMASMLADYGVPISDEGSEGLEGIGEEIRQWATDNSNFDDVGVGGYHSGYGDTTQDYWRVEQDPSIQGEGVGAEIISPVYESPREMMTEMRSLFQWMYNNNVYTNRSTGLHITMSVRGDERRPNRVKMAVMLDDQHLLRNFNREFNDYTSSQQRRLVSAAQSLQAGDTQSLEKLEDALRDAVGSEKYRSIHFKNAINDSGNQLIEFRIAGGDDYLSDFDKARDLIVRYATTMQLGHDPDAYRREYATKLLRLVSKAADLGYEMKAPGNTEHFRMLVQGIRELGLTDAGRLRNVKDRLEWMLTHTDPNAEDNESSIKYPLREIFYTLAMAVYEKEVKNSGTRVARLLRKALDGYLGGDVVTRIFQIVLEERGDKQLVKIATGLSELLAAPRAAEKMGINMIQHRIRVPREHTLLVKGSLLQDVKNASPGQMPDNVEDRMVILPHDIKYEVKSAGILRGRASSDTAEEIKWQQDLAMERILELMRAYGREAGGPIDIDLDIDDHYIRPMINWFEKPLDDNKYYMLPHEYAVEDRGSYLDWLNRFREVGIDIDYP